MVTPEFVDPIDRARSAVRRSRHVSPPRRPTATCIAAATWKCRLHCNPTTRPVGLRRRIVRRQRLRATAANLWQWRPMPTADTAPMITDGVQHARRRRLRRRSYGPTMATPGTIAGPGTAPQPCAATPSCPQTSTSRCRTSRPIAAAGTPPDRRGDQPAERHPCRRERPSQPHRPASAAVHGAAALQPAAPAGFHAQCIQSE